MFEQFIGTKPVEERHRIDVGRLEKFLGFKIRHARAVQGRPVQSHLQADICRRPRFRIETKAAGQAAPSAHAVDREYRVIAALHKAGFLWRAHVLCEDDSVIGTAFYVMDYVEGRVLWDQSLRDDEGRTRRRSGTS